MLGEYRFDAATRALRDFAWNEFCDWYVEMLKPRLKDEATTRRGAADARRRPRRRSCACSRPSRPSSARSSGAPWAELAPERGLPAPSTARSRPAWSPRGPSRRPRGATRRWRAASGVCRRSSPRCGTSGPPTGSTTGRSSSSTLRCPAAVAAQIADVAGVPREPGPRTSLAAAGPDVTRPGASASFSTADVDGFIPLEGVVDREAELARQRKEADKVRGFIAGHEKKLANQGFVAKAPAEVVDAGQGDPRRAQEAAREHRGDRGRPGSVGRGKRRGPPPAVYPLSPPASRPATKRRCRPKNRMTSGRV